MCTVLAAAVDVTFGSLLFILELFAYVQDSVDLLLGAGCKGDLEALQRPEGETEIEHQMSAWTS